jgi:hypothetical protein
MHVCGLRRRRDMADAKRHGNAIKLGTTLREARRISRKLNDPTWIENVLSELGEAITFAKDHHEDWGRVLIDTFDDGLPWASTGDRDTLIRFLVTEQNLSFRTTATLLKVGLGTVNVLFNPRPPRRQMPRA